MTTSASQEAPFLAEDPTHTPDQQAQLQCRAAKDRRQKFLSAILITVIGLGASIMSCVGQSFGYRQARALEEIQHQLHEIRMHCAGKMP